MKLSRDKYIKTGRQWEANFLITFLNTILGMPPRFSDEFYNTIGLRCAKIVQMVSYLPFNTHCAKNVSAWVVSHIPITGP